MSKRKGKAAPKKAAPKKAARKPMKRGAPARRSRTALTSSTETTNGRGFTSQVTIFLFRTGSGNKIPTAPQRPYAGPGQIEWTVLNMIDGSDVPVRITWVDQAPFKALEFRTRHVETIPEGVSGIFKYVVHAYDTKEDPEVEIPWN